MSFITAKEPPWRSEENPLGPPETPVSEATPVSAAALADLENRVQQGLQTLLGLIPTVSGVAVLPWSSATTYSAGQWVSRTGNIYVSNVNGNLNHDPATDTSSTYWTSASLGPAVVNSSNSSVAKKFYVPKSQGDGTYQWQSEGLQVLVPEAYGALSTPGNIHDDTAAWKDLIADAWATYVTKGRYVRAQMAPNVVYGLSGAPDTSHGGNSILSFPLTQTPNDNFSTSPNGGFELVGGPGYSGHGGDYAYGTIAGSNSGGFPSIPYFGSGFQYIGANDKTYSSVYGPPSLIGGPTTEHSGYGNFDWYQVKFKDFGISLPVNSTLSGIDSIGILDSRFNNVGVFCGTLDDTSTAPNNWWQFGIRTGGEGDGLDQCVEGCSALQCYTGLVMPGGHLWCNRWQSTFCFAALGVCDLTDDPHPLLLGYIGFTGCQYSLTGWFLGADGGPAPLNSGMHAYLRIMLFDGEDTIGSGAWNDRQINILDPNNCFHGDYHYNYDGHNTTTGALGHNAVPWLVDGAAFFPGTAM